jgi:membrane protease YdiL (CAAX protease family)
MYEVEPPEWPVSPAPYEPDRGRPHRKGWALIAWIVILPLVGFVVVAQELEKRLPAGADEGAEHTEEIMARMQGRYLVGARGAPGVRGEDLLDQARDLNHGSVGQRLRFVILTGELIGPEKALERLGELDELIADRAVMPTEDEELALDILGRLYEDYTAKRWTAPSVNAAERELLKRELGWYGDLALTPPNHPEPAAREQVLAPARRTAWILIGGLIGAGAFGLFGFIFLIMFAVMAANGTIRSGLEIEDEPKENEPVLLQPVDEPPVLLPVDEPGPGPLSQAYPDPSLTDPASFEGDPSSTERRIIAGGVYAETFAVWLVLFLIFSTVAVLLPGNDKLLLAGVGMLLSLLAVLWPVLRGVSWRQVRRDAGLALGRNPLVEIVMAIPCYAMTIPLFVVGLLLTLLLMHWFPGDSAAQLAPLAQGRKIAHPIIGPAAEAKGWQLAQIFLLASFCAPVVEETMFRGFLYRHLREATNRWGVFLSLLLSATASSFLFAAIHPQGLVAVPALMGLAFGFCLAREWRGTLLTPMIMHAFHNGMLLFFLTQAVN